MNPRKHRVILAFMRPVDIETVYANILTTSVTVYGHMLPPDQRLDCVLCTHPGLTRASSVRYCLACSEDYYNMLSGIRKGHQPVFPREWLN